MDRPVINSGVLGRMVGLADWCYKCGVEDAYRTGDEGLCREFLDRIDPPLIFGLLPDKLMVWKEWAVRLLSKARLTAWNGVMTDYFKRAGKLGGNYLGVFYIITQEYYNRGVSDYLDNPAACVYEVFMDTKRVAWTARGLRKVSNPQYKNDMQLICYDYRRKSESIIADSKTANEAKKRGAIRLNQWDYFIRALGLIPD